MLGFMLVQKQRVLVELDLYGIRDITTVGPVIGLDGLIKDAALFITFNFDFLGTKTVSTNLYAFPRTGIKDVLDTEIPEAIHEAQLLYILAAMRECSINGKALHSFGSGENVTRLGETSEHRKNSSNVLFLNMNQILEQYLTTKNPFEFILEDT